MTTAHETHSQGRSPRVPSVVRDPSPDELRAVIDWSEWYLDWEDDVGQGTEHDQGIKVTRSCVEELVRARSWSKLMVGHDQFYAWIEDEPRVRVSPDVYLLDQPPLRPWPDIWETWRPGVLPPRWVLEVVSPKWRKKDYDINPDKYAMLGTTELVIFDPEAPVEESSRGREKWPLQVYHRDHDGLFIRAYKGPGPVWSQQLDVCLVSDRSGPVPVLRIALDAEGKNLVPTADEARQAAETVSAQERLARQAAETASAQERLARQTAETVSAQERLARQTAEAELKALREQLEALRGAQGS